MGQTQDVMQWRKDLVEALREGDEARARARLAQLNVRKARPLLEVMLEDPDARVRQAAAFGLGELGGAASVRRLEQQLVQEEARGGHDGAAVTEALTQALGRIRSASARERLTRRLARLVATGSPEPADLNDVVCALWRLRHPDLTPLLQQCLARLPASTPTALHGLQVLLEKSPAALRAWAAEGSVPVALKGEVLAVLTEELPEELLPVLPAFISSARLLVDTAARSKGEAASYCVDLFALLLLNAERLLPGLSDAARSELRDMARRLVVGTSLLKLSLQSAVLLQHVGRPEDVALLEAHRPVEPVLAKVFDEAARVLRGRT